MAAPRRFLLLMVCAAWVAASGTGIAAADGEVGTYPLDDRPRVLPVGAPLDCRVPLTTYRGTEVRYQRPGRVFVGFVPRLQAFERVLVEQAVRHYGRAPRQLVHLGTHNCRRMRGYPEWVSEHALANAIDLAGLDFGPLAKGATAPAGMPRALQRSFGVRVEAHWNGRGALAEWHGVFLRALADALMARPDIFRVMLGPGFPGHKNHFHLDYAPYRLVDGF